MRTAIFLLVIFFSTSEAVLGQKWSCSDNKLTAPNIYFEYGILDFDNGVYLSRWEFACSIAGIDATAFSNGETNFFDQAPGARQKCIAAWTEAMRTEDTSELERIYSPTGFDYDYTPKTEASVIELHSEDALYLRFHVISPTGEKGDMIVLNKKYETNLGSFVKWGQSDYAAKMNCEKMSN